jgi:lipopolysaccharide transport system ATP-binding protein
VTPSNLTSGQQFPTGYHEGVRAEAAISVAGLSKTYRLLHRADRPTTAREALIARLRNPLARSQVEYLSALRDVSFEVPWGEALGIIGRNGAGKSTLLKILTRITAPTTGRVELGGRVGSLLEVGTGFHPELTGRENVVLNGTLLGMKKKEIVRRFDEIVEFAGVSKFLDTQVKRYSTGMYIRLAFAVAAHLESEILAVDEVLAVGDADFQAKCLGKMREVVRSGRTVLLVSHQLPSVQALCTSAIYMERGSVISHGSVEDALETYKQSFVGIALEHQDPSQRPGTGELRFTSASTSKDVYEPAEAKKIEFATTRNPKMVGSCFVSCHINNADGVTIAQCDSRAVGFWLDPDVASNATFLLEGPWLQPGRYTVDLFLCKAGILDQWEGAVAFEVLPITPYPNDVGAEGSSRGIVLPAFSYTS